jgi:hypothetical protein
MVMRTDLNNQLCQGLVMLALSVIVTVYSLSVVRDMERAVKHASSMNRRESLKLRVSVFAVRARRTMACAGLVIVLIACATMTIGACFECAQRGSWILMPLLVWPCALFNMRTLLTSLAASVRLRSSVGGTTRPWLGLLLVKSHSQPEAALRLGFARAEEQKADGSLSHKDMDAEAMSEEGKRRAFASTARGSFTRTSHELLSDQMASNNKASRKRTTSRSSSSSSGLPRKYTLGRLAMMAAKMSAVTEVEYEGTVIASSIADPVAIVQPGGFRSSQVPESVKEDEDTDLSQTPNTRQRMPSF